MSIDKPKSFTVSKDKFILDATAGFRMMWFNKHHPNALYIDKRFECEPDQVANFKSLPYKDKSFKLILFDPPHIIQSSTETQSGIISNYGSLQPENWQSEIKRGFQELWRLLDDYGVLLFKWANSHIDSDRIIELLPEKPIVYQITASQVRKWANGNKSSREPHKIRTLWFCFMKIPEKEAI